MALQLVAFRKGPPVILVVGDAMLDKYWFGDVTRVSPEAPVPVVLVEREEVRLGGAANVAHNIVSLGGKAKLLSRVGPGADTQVLIDLCKRNGIDYEFSGIYGQTIVKLRIIGKHQQIVRADFEQPFKPLDLEGLHLMHEWFVVSDYCKGTIGDLRELRGKKFLVDTKSTNYKKYEGCYLLKQNVPDFAHSAQGKTPQEVRNEIGATAVLITKADKGMTLYTNEGEYDIPSEAKEVFDVTGAGDTVMATLAVFLSEGAPLKDAAILANKAGGIVVGKFGTATVTREELGIA